MTDDEAKRWLWERKKLMDGRYTAAFPKWTQGDYVALCLVLQQLHAPHSLDSLVDTVTALRGAVSDLRSALEESLRLQAHYAKLLNMYDGGSRMVFGSVEEWLERLKEMERPRALEQ